MKKLYIYIYTYIEHVNLRKNI